MHRFSTPPAEMAPLLRRQVAPVDERASLATSTVVTKVAALDASGAAPYAGISMKSWRSAAAMATLCLLAATRASRADDEATLLRLFLRDGTSLVSYGEFARVADRVVFSMPVDSTTNPPLQLVNIPADRVDWARTDRYAETARAARYTVTQGESDYVALNNAVSRALNEVALTPDPARRVAIVEEARKTLAEWPQSHFRYRIGDVRQMLGMLDEAIADLRATAGGTRFDLSLVAVAEPVAPIEPLLPPPTPVEMIEQLVTASQLSESAAERQSIQSVVLSRLDRDPASFPREWAIATRAAISASVDSDARIDRTYQAMINRSLGQAAARARVGDVSSIRLVLERLRQNDAALGRQRPDAVSAAIAAVEARLDQARALRLARDHWALRAPVLRRYGRVMATPLWIFSSLQKPLEDIKELAGSTEAALAVVQRRAGRASKRMATIVPPEECLAAHAVLVSAAQLADSAARIRHDATLTGDLSRARDASSAAAGALMLIARARAEIQSFLRPPQLP
jgi:hypothetical protein